MRHQKLSQICRSVRDTNKVKFDRRLSCATERPKEMASKIFNFEPAQIPIIDL